MRTIEHYNGCQFDGCEHSRTCRHCGQAIWWAQGCWNSADGYACPAITVGMDEHQPAD